MHILVQVPSGVVPTGALRRLLTLAKGLQDKGHNLTICSGFHMASAEEISKSKGLNYISGASSLPVSPPAGRFAKLRRALLLLSGAGSEPLAYVSAMKGLVNRPDVIVARNALGVLAVRRAAGDVPIVWDVGIETRQPMRCILLNAAGRKVRAIVLQSKLQSKAIFGKLEPRFRGKLNFLIPAIELGSGPADRVVCPAWMPRGAVIVQVATLCPRKNQSTTLLAFAHALRNPVFAAAKPSLVLVGDGDSGDFEVRLRRQARDLGVLDNVVFAGWRNDVRCALAHAKLAVLPSLDEGVPNVVQESMWLGVPTAAARVGGVPELIRDGVTGWLHDPLDHEALASIMVSTVCDPDSAREIAEAGKLHAHRTFGMEAWVREYENVLQRVLDQRAIE